MSERSILFSGVLDQLLSVAQGFRRDALSGKHAANFTRAGFCIQFLNSSDGASAFRVLLHIIMMIGEASDLREVGHA